MRLTGKAEKDFFEWYRSTDFKVRNQPGLALFYNYPESMQYGVYVDFFDSVEDESEVRILGKVSRGIDKYFFELKGNMYAYNTRQEAQIEAIKKADENYKLK